MIFILKNLIVQHCTTKLDGFLVPQVLSFGRFDEATFVQVKHVKLIGFLRGGGDSPNLP